MEALLDRDAELGELGRLLAAARAGSGRVIVVAGPAGIGKSTLLAAAGATARTDGAVVLRARCSPLEQHAAWGMARQLFDPLRARPDWDGLTAGAAGLAGRVLAPEAGEPANAGDAMHAAVRGLVWLASNLGERGPAVFAVDDVHWADARPCAGSRCWPGPWTSCRSGCYARCARVSRPRRLICWPSCWPARPSRRCARGRSGPRRYRRWYAGGCPRRQPGSPRPATP